MPPPNPHPPALGPDLRRVRVDPAESDEVLLGAVGVDLILIGSLAAVRRARLRARRQGGWRDTSERQIKRWGAESGGGGRTGQGRGAS
eukprot:4035982-Prymnesium_polylepis.1